MLGLATRSRVAGHLRADAGSTRDPNHRGKVIIDITGEPAGPPKILGGGPLCSWGSPQAGGVTFRIAPPGFDIPKSKAAATNEVPLVPPNANANAKKGKSKGKKKIWQP
jgi:hypothetical protein